MTKTAIVVLATMSRYHDAVIAANPVFRDDEVPPALAELVTESALEVQVRLRREQLHLRYNGLLRIPYDYGVIAVDVRSPDEAYVYGWTFGNNWRLRGRTDLEFGDLVDNAQFTDHTLSLLRSNEGGTWQLYIHFSARTHWERTGTAAAIFTPAWPQFLPYYELNAAARRALGVMEFEEWYERGVISSAPSPDTAPRTGADATLSSATRLVIRGRPHTDYL